MLDNETQIGTGHVMPFALKAGLGVWMCGVIAAAFLYVPPAVGFASPDAARMVLFHIPCSMMAVVAYIVSLIYALIYLSKGKMIADEKSAISAGLGFLFTALATATGMVFARVQWGVYWDWNNPRMTSILMLIMIYAAYFLLRSSIPGAKARAKISAAYNIIAGLLMPFFVFIMPRMFVPGSHPNNTLTSREGLSFEYKIVLICAMIGFTWLYIWMFRMQVRVAEYILAAGRIRVE